MAASDKPQRGALFKTGWVLLVLVSALMALNHFALGVASRMVGFFASTRQALPQDLIADLTTREREVLELIARGEANTRIAERLSLNLKTVRN